MNPYLSGDGRAMKMERPTENLWNGPFLAKKVNQNNNAFHERVGAENE